MTSPTNIIDELSDETLDKILEVRTSITSAIKRENVINQIRLIIDNSDSVSFISERARKFISVSRPMLDLEIDVEKAAIKFPHLKEDLVNSIAKIKAKEGKQNVSEMFRDEIINARDEVIRVEVINPFMNFMKAIFSKILHDIIPEDVIDYQDIIESMLKDFDLKQLRDTITNIYPKIVDEVAVDDYNFAFGVISATNHGPENLHEDFNIALELLF